MTIHDWSPPYPPALYIALGIGLLVLLLLARFFAKSATARRWPLLFLRGAVLAVLLLILLNRVRISETRLPPRTPEVAYLVDCSRSMALDRPTSRMNQVKRLVTADQRRPATETPPRISLYRFGDRLQACANASDLAPVDDNTRLLEALEQLPGRFRDGRPAGVVIFSDGRATETTGFEELAAGYKRLGVPLHVYPVGDARVSGDVAIEDVVAPRDAPAGSRLPVRVVVRCRGYSGRRAELHIRSLTDPKRPPLATLPIMLAEGQQTHELRIDQLPGPGQFVVEVPPLEGEAILDNNRVAFQIGARRSKIRVIYMEGTQNNEYHWIRDALIEDPNIECVAMEVNNQYDARPTLHRVNDPARGFPTTREELFSYDVLICSDISRFAFSQAQLDWVLELVNKRGGGFAMVGGHTSFGSGNWGKTTWDGLIPVDMSREGQGPGGFPYLSQEFRVRVPAEVENHPIWRFVDDPIRNRQILAQMPPFSGTNLIRYLKPAAMVLGVSDRPLANCGIMPVFACEPYGEGRTFAMSTDSTEAWGTLFESLWGEPGDNRYFRKFWRNVVQWLAEHSAGANRRLRLETDKVIYRPGQPIKILARAYDEKLEETNRYRLSARLRPAGPGTVPLQETALAAQPTERGYVGEMTTPPLNLVPVSASNPLSQMRLATLDVVAYEGDKVTAQSNLDVQILDDPPEFQDPRPDAERLEELAKLSGGKVLRDPDDLTALLGTFTSTAGDLVVSKAPLWDHPLWWLLLVVLLTVDWGLRRWWGLA